MRLLNIEHYVELAHIFEVLVQRLHQIVNEFEESQLVLHDKNWSFECSVGESTYDVLIVINAYDKIERSIAAIDYFILAMLEETALVLRPTQAFTNQFTFESDSFAHTETIKVFGEACLTLLVDH